MKKSWKQFWTLDRHCAEGFTLVELIVVIAILAILGGVAVPAYSGYVQKAERVADEQLLDAINTAFAAACIENGVDMALLGDTGASMPLAEDKTVRLDGVAPYGDAFKRYYAGNEASAFNVFNSIVYDAAKGMFVNMADAKQAVLNVNGKTYKVDGEAVTAYLNSSLGEMDSSTLLGMINGLAEKFGNGFGNEALPLALASGSYQEAALALMGVTDMSYADYIAAKKDAAYEQYLDDNHPEFDPNSRGPAAAAIRAEAEAAANEQIAAMEKNMLVLVGASKAEEASQTILNVLKQDDALTVIKGNVKGENGGNSALGTSQSALAYALYTSYKGEQASYADFLLALEDRESEDGKKFQEYLNDDQALIDLEGAKGAMSMIGNQDSDTLEFTAMNGLNNAELEDALAQILGK